MDRPPFLPAAVFSARQRLGMSTLDVARQMNLLGASVDTDAIAAFESGARCPTEGELFALADVLWCRTPELMGIERPRTLAELRLSRQFTVPRLARAIGMDVHTYTQAEEKNEWAGNSAQTPALLHALNISLLQLQEAAVLQRPLAPVPEPGPTPPAEGPEL
ncbi:helix-turn-helix domain-containing protein [Streptomyces sp. NPDC002491]